LRSVGLFGGEQPEFFLAGPDLRREPPPIADAATRVLDVSEVDNFRDPTAEPAIDRCGSRLQSTDDGEIEVTILWHDRNCPDSFDEEDSEDCHSRADFGFSPRDLGMQDLLERDENASDALERLLVVDAYFTQEVQPEKRHPATGVQSAPKSTVHLVVRVIRASETTGARAATTTELGGDSCRRS